MSRFRTDNSNVMGRAKEWPSGCQSSIFDTECERDFLIMGDRFFLRLGRYNFSPALSLVKLCSPHLHVKFLLKKTPFEGIQSLGITVLRSERRGGRKSYLSAQSACFPLQIINFVLFSPCELFSNKQDH